MQETMTMRNRLAVVLGIVAVVLTLAVAAQTDVTGEWTMTSNTEQGSSSAALTLNQDGEKLTGELVAPEVGTLEFEGTITSNKVAWVIEFDAGGQFIEIAFEGTVDGDEMTGTLDVAGYIGGDWTAKRAQ